VGRLLGVATLVDGALPIPDVRFLSPVHGRRCIHAYSLCLSRNCMSRIPVFLEEEIPRVEASIAHTEEQLGVYVSAAETQRLTELAAALGEQLGALTAEWEELMLQLGGA